VDSQYLVAEKDETNNGLAGGAFQVLGLTSYVMSSNIPASMRKGQSYAISVTMWNDGTAPWTAAGGFELGAVSPEGTTRWGVSRVSLPGGQTVNPGGTVTFSFNVTAPSEPGWYPCHWQMVHGEEFFGEVATGASKIRVVDDALYGQDIPAISGNRVAYMDYNNIYRQYLVPAISVTYLPNMTRMTLPEDIPFPRDKSGAPKPPYQYFDISNHYFPDISGSWVTWIVDDKPDNPTSPSLWYYQVTVYNVGSPSELPRRIVYANWDALFPAIDGNFVVWEDYRNDPDKLANPKDFLSDNSDIYIYDIASNTSYALCTAPGPQFAPRISGNLVVWEDWRDTVTPQADIYLYDLSVDTDGDGTPNWKDSDRPNPDPAEARLTGLSPETQFTSEEYPDISGRRVVWMDLRRDVGLGTTVDIYLRDLDGPTETAVAADPAATRMQPRIDGTKATWTDLRHGYGDVYWMDVLTGAGGPVAGSGAEESLSDLSGDRLAYAKLRTIVTKVVNSQQIQWPVYNVWVQQMLKNGCVGVHTFSDANSGHWAWEYIEAVVKNGVAQGYGDAYQPTWVVSRDQMAVYIARAEGWVQIGDDMTTAPELFEDVPAGFWAGTAIQACVGNGVVQGYDADHYGPGDAVTRDQMAVFVARAKGWVSIGDDMTTAPELFSDVPAGFWCGTAIQACVENGVVKGYEDGSYQPSGVVTRDQMAVYVSRAYGYSFP